MAYKVERQSYPRYPEVWKVIDISTNTSVAQFNSREQALKKKRHLDGPKPSTDSKPPAEQEEQPQEEPQGT